MKYLLTCAHVVILCLRMATTSQTVKVSDIYLAAWIAAEKALPEESKQLIEAHDTLFAKWRESGWPKPIPPELVAASDAIEADPMAKIPFEFRQRCNQAGSDEWRKANP